MNLSDFHPRLSDATLLFTMEGKGQIHDLRGGLRLFLSRYHPAATALFMIESCNFNYHIARDRSARVILMTTDGLALAEAIIIDLYTKLVQHKSTITTQRAAYTCSLEGYVDMQRVSILSMHNLWLSQAFDQQPDGKGERFLLN